MHAYYSLFSLGFDLLFHFCLPKQMKDKLARKKSKNAQEGKTFAIE